MNNDRYYYFREDVDVEMEIELAKITDDERQLFGNYVEKTRHFIELFKLYKVFRCNLRLLLDNFELKVTDTLIYLNNANLTDNELEIQINTFTINFLASGRTLMESVDVYLKACLGNAVFDEFRQTVSSRIYDESFSYKLLPYLRNYSQHGHLPVEVAEKRACFNLDAILNKPHTKKMNKAVRAEMQDLREKILYESGGNPLIAYTFTIADINFYTTEIYFEFLKFIKADFKSVYENVQSVVNKQPDIVCKGIVYYDIEDDFLHCFDPKNNPLSLYSRVKKGVKKDLRAEECELTRIKRTLEKIDPIEPDRQ